MSTDAGLLDLVYVGVFLGNIVLLAALWRVGSLTARGRHGRSTDRWTVPAPTARGRSVEPAGLADGDGGRARTARYGDAGPSHAASDAHAPRL